MIEERCVPASKVQERDITLARMEDAEHHPIANAYSFKVRPVDTEVFRSVLDEASSVCLATSTIKCLCRAGNSWTRATPR